MTDRDWALEPAYRLAWPARLASLLRFHWSEWCRLAQHCRCLLQSSHPWFPLSLPQALSVALKRPLQTAAKRRLLQTEKLALAALMHQSKPAQFPLE
jgi:hypothetical protein